MTVPQSILNILNSVVLQKMPLFGTKTNTLEVYSVMYFTRYFIVVTK
jgi:hypothetical protein